MTCTVHGSVRLGTRRTIATARVPGVGLDEGTICRSSSLRQSGRRSNGALVVTNLRLQVDTRGKRMHMKGFVAVFACAFGVLTRSLICAAWTSVDQPMFDFVTWFVPR